MIILGIDPGIATTGYAVVKKDGNKFETFDYGCILTKKGGKLESRLFEISEKLKIIIQKYKPNRVGIEQLFFCKNVKTAMMVGQARGAILLTITNYDLPVYEFTPLQIKQAVSGYGKADKQQVQKMIQIILKLKEIPKPDDAADALAIAYTCGVSNNTIV